MATVPRWKAPGKGGRGQAAAVKENQQQPAMNEENALIESKILRRLSPRKTRSSRVPLQDENSATSKNQMKFQVKCTVKCETQRRKRGEQKVCVSDAGDSTKSSKELNKEQNVSEEGEETAAIASPAGGKSPRKGKSAAQSPGNKSTKTNAKCVRRKCIGKPRKRTPVKSPSGRYHKVTDYYPIRRSCRKCEGQLKSEEKKIIDELIRTGKEEGMKVSIIDGKGRGVMATKPFQRGDFVVEYHGDLIEFADAKNREAEYAQDPSTGCYMYYFQYLSKTYCVDATKETMRLGRLINHSKNGNCQTKLHDVDGKPHLILVASRDIEDGEELLYDYGDRSKASIAAHPWLKQ
ncbi:N-lysine methyltransferase KMT5A-like isoform X2 [Pristis pectinata]|uniref:N-lysine methyltransferase KMT5A-like isoform X2 n=1 Tax=Pristis pectinata TaxID=685728 RepID=UPI00223DAFCC|nr:N-lysine methyltransferase KMT5A-like isoform X2 [Pristis pectinata]